MIVENLEALKSWLSELLEPICEADPSALSNYVVALVTKDKPEEDLKALCADQLDVFLQKETDRFVEKLFHSLTTKNYLEAPAKEILSKETELPGGKHAGEVSHVEVSRDGRRKRSSLKIQSDFNESRTRDDRRIDDRKRRDRFRKHTEPRREHRHRPADRGHGHSSSYSHSRRRSRSRGDGSGETKSRDGGSSRGREHRPKLGEQGKDPEVHAPVPGSSCDPPQQQQLHTPAPQPLQPQHPQHSPCSRGPVTPSSVAVATPAHLPDSTTESCRGDEKGGDLCPFGHGNDPSPSVVDNFTLPAMIPFPPLPGGPLTRTATPTHGQAPPPDAGPTPGSKCAEAYNPEAPGCVEPGRAQHRQFIPQVHTQRPNLIGLSSRDLDAPISRATDMVIQTEPNVPAAQDNSSRRSEEHESRKKTLGASEGPQPKKINFNNQLKPTFQKKNHFYNTKLEVRKIPRDLNNITKLNQHFSAFGTIVNIQVAFGGGPEAALIQYASNDEARRAISSTEAVLNNRFIQVHWHSDGNEQELHQPPGQSYGAPSGSRHASVHKVIMKQQGPGAYMLNKTVAKAAPTSEAGSKPTVQRIVSAPLLAKTTSVSLQERVYSSPIMMSTSKSVGKVARALEAQEAKKKKQEALKLQRDMRKVKQKMLEKQIECHKVFINRLENNKAMKPEERANIMKMLKELSAKICRLKDDVRSASVSTPGSARPKRETDTQKELLDAELDLHKKLTSRKGTTDLQKKLSQLQVEATRFGLFPVRGKVPTKQDHGRGRGPGGGGHLVVDHRPRTLTVPGVSNEEEELRPHFVAENQGAKFKSSTFEISRFKPETSSEPIKPEDDSKEESVISVFVPDEDDDDDEDDHESRSWRR